MVLRDVVDFDLGVVYVAEVRGSVDVVGEEAPAMLGLILKCVPMAGRIVWSRDCLQGRVD